MNVARCDMGTGMTADEVAELTGRADVAGVRAYRSAVGRATREVARTLPAAAWDEILARADTARAAAVGAFGPNDDWSDDIGHRPWQAHPRGDQLAVALLWSRHDPQTPPRWPRARYTTAPSIQQEGDAAWA
jgi:hypothetical protein